MAENAREWTTFGRYVLLDKIGTGGMAEIYRAKTFGAADSYKYINGVLDRIAHELRADDIAAGL